jgi:hypothetical protein
MTPWDESDSQLFTSVQNAVVLGISVHERVFRLNCGHRLNCMRSTDSLGARLREAKVQDLSFGDQVFNRASDIFDWDVWIDAVLIEEIDPVGTETF